MSEAGQRTKLLVRNRKRWPIGRGLIVGGLVLVALTASGFWLSSRPRDPSRTDLLQSAWNEFAAGRFDQAGSFLDQRAREVAPTPLDRMLRARIAESQGRLAEALDHLKQIADTDSIAAQAWLKTGQIELARRRAGAAEAAYLHALKINPDQIQARRELAYLYAIERRKAECDAQFRALSRLMPMGYVLAFAWCQNYCGIWDPDEAAKVLTGFLAQEPQDRTSRLALAKSFQLTNKLAEAEETLSPLGRSDPDANTLRAQMAIERGDIRSALELARPGPHDHQRLNCVRGQLALHQADPRRAAAFFRQALVSDPEDRDAIRGLGVALRQLGDPAAKQLLDHAERFDKLKRTIVESVTTLQTDLRLFCTLGTLCESLGRLDQARVWYRIAIERDPLDSEAQQGLTRANHADAGQAADSASR
jgi:tetratricopeptide (TPR) repeat protein